MKESKIKAVENFLLTGRVLTKKHAYEKWFYTNLGDAILRLRAKYGHDNIITKMTKTGNTTHAEYFLKPSYILLNVSKLK